MIFVLPIRAVFSTIAALYAAGIVAALSFGDSGGALDNIILAFKWVTLLNIALLVIGHVAWQHVWERFPQLNEWVFPNLNGQWDMKIHWFGAREHNAIDVSKGGAIDAKAIIKQTLFSVSMEVSAPGSDSETLAVMPKRDPESGRAIVFYMYRVVPKKTTAGAGDAYEGSAILKVGSMGAQQLAGNYHTSRHTIGHFELRRTT